MHLFVCQSLLCSKFTSTELTNHVLKAVEGDHTLRGRESLHILCLGHVRPRATIDMILDKFPEIMPAFAVQTFGTDYDLVSLNSYHQ